ncbi:AC4 [Malvastrum yellow mosaic Helshire virus]|uniref:AC4 n=1 Tax=Malvastrum yellow mosaic Helshire virus TaxID=643133 RepID=C3UP45_9GEMI|nr:AC4 [Malvastrum yellow mosaic Helshire virus]ACQ57340.1 AC4 [Malvastrum yellow mosaic Helshire virus]
MGSLISMCSCSSKASSTARITDSSTWCPQPGQHLSIQTFRELGRAPMSSPMSRKTVTPSNGECSRSTEEVLVAVSRQLMMQPPRR